MSKTEIDIELTAACNKLRIMIRNEQLEKDYADAWHKLSQTSTIKRRIRLSSPVERKSNNLF